MGRCWCCSSTPSTIASNGVESSNICTAPPTGCEGIGDLSGDAWGNALTTTSLALRTYCAVCCFNSIIWRISALVGSSLTSAFSINGKMMLSLMASDNGSTNIYDAIPATAVTKFALGRKRTLPPLKTNYGCGGGWTEGSENVPVGLSSGTAL